MRIITRLNQVGDRLLTRLVPGLTASAGYCSCEIGTTICVPNAPCAGSRCIASWGGCGFVGGVYEECC